MKERIAAYSILETLLAVSLLALIAVVPFALNSTMVFRIEADGVQSEVGHALRTAQLFAEQSRFSDTWSVYIQPQSITIFKGSSYASRNTEYDNVYSYDKKVSLSVTSGSSTVTFSKHTGSPSSNLTVLITASGSSSRSVIFSNSGALTYN